MRTVRLAAIGAVAWFALASCSRGGETLTPLIHGEGPSDTGSAGDRQGHGGDGANRTEVAKDFELAPVELATEPHSGPWTPIATVPVRPLTLAPNLETRERRDWKEHEDGLRRAPQADSPPRAVGLLVSVAWWASAPPSCRGAAPQDRVEYNFSLGGSHYALYFPSDGRGFNVLNNWSVDLPFQEGGAGTFRIDAAMFRADTPNPWGLESCAHLVELEVNHGRGGRGIHFIATALRVVEGTEVFAGRAQEVLESLTGRFLASAEIHRGALREEFRRVQAQWARHRPPQELSIDRVEMGPESASATWNDDTHELEVVLQHRGQIKSSSVVGREVIPPSTCPPGAPCAYRESGTFDLVATWTLRAEFAVHYRVDREARLVEETIYLPRVTFAQNSERRRVKG